jgi:hypothetical protein
MTGHVSHPAGPLIGAFAIVAVLSLVAVFAFRRPNARGGLLNGYDQRISTSKTVQYMWTVVVAWMVASEALIVLFGDPTLTSTNSAGVATTAAATFGQWMRHTFDTTPDWQLYLVFLGGPYAAYAFAKISVSNRVNDGTVQKTDGERNQPLAAVRNDTGAVDPADFQ